MVEIRDPLRTFLPYLLVPVLLSSAWGSPLEFVPTETIYPPRNTPRAIQVFSDAPNQAFVRVGVIRWDVWRPGSRAPYITEVLPDLRKKAWEVGGDALIIRKAQRGRGEKGRDWNILVIAEVIRWR